MERARKGVHKLVTKKRAAEALQAGMRIAQEYKKSDQGRDREQKFELSEDQRKADDAPPAAAVLGKPPPIKTSTSSSRMGPRPSPIRGPDRPGWGPEDVDVYAAVKETGKEPRPAAPVAPGMTGVEHWLRGLWAWWSS